MVFFFVMVKLFVSLVVKKARLDYNKNRNGYR